MPTTVENNTTPTREAELIMDDRTADGPPTEVGALRRVGDTWWAMRSTGVRALTEATMAKVLDEDLMLVGSGEVSMKRDLVVPDGKAILIENGGELLLI